MAKKKNVPAFYVSFYLPPFCWHLGRFWRSPTLPSASRGPGHRVGPDRLRSWLWGPLRSFSSRGVFKRFLSRGAYLRSWNYKPYLFSRKWLFWGSEGVRDFLFFHLTPPLNFIELWIRISRTFLQENFLGKTYDHKISSLDQWKKGVRSFVFFISSFLVNWWSLFFPGGCGQGPFSPLDCPG